MEYNTFLDVGVHGVLGGEYLANNLGHVELLLAFTFQNCLILPILPIYAFEVVPCVELIQCGIEARSHHDINYVAHQQTHYHVVCDAHPAIEACEDFLTRDP